MWRIQLFDDAHAAPYAGGDQRDRESAARAGQRRRGKRADRPQQHAAGKVAAQMIHLADQRDPGTEDDRADAGAEVGKDRPAAAGEPGAEPMGGDDAGEQDGQPRQARDLDPVGRDECEECRRDQEAADDADDHGDVGAGSERRKCAPDGGRGRRRDHAIGLPSRKVSFEALPVKPVEHGQESPARAALGSGVGTDWAARYSRASALNLQVQFPTPHGSPPFARPAYHRAGCIGNGSCLLTGAARHAAPANLPKSRSARQSREGRAPVAVEQGGPSLYRDYERRRGAISNSYATLRIFRMKRQPMSPPSGKSHMTLFHMHHSRPHRFAGVDRFSFVRLIKRTRAALRKIHRATAAARIRRLRTELMLHSRASSDRTQPRGHEVDAGRDIARIPRPPLNSWREVGLLTCVGFRRYRPPSQGRCMPRHECCSGFSPGLEMNRSGPIARKRITCAVRDRRGGRNTARASLRSMADVRQIVGGVLRNHGRDGGSRQKCDERARSQEVLRDESPLQRLLFRLKRLPAEFGFSCGTSSVAARARWRRTSSICARYCFRVIRSPSCCRSTAAHTSRLVLRKKLKLNSSSCRRPRRSISFAIASTPSRSALSRVSASRRTARCHARGGQACLSAEPCESAGDAMIGQWPPGIRLRPRRPGLRP